MISVGPEPEAVVPASKILAAICEGRVGAVLSLEASRLARNMPSPGLCGVLAD